LVLAALPAQAQWETLTGRLTRQAHLETDPPGAQVEQWGQRERGTTPDFSVRIPLEDGRPAAGTMHFVLEKEGYRTEKVTFSYRPEMSEPLELGRVSLRPARWDTFLARYPAALLAPVALAALGLPLAVRHVRQRRLRELGLQRGADPRLGSRVGPYTLLSHLGSGGMGAVYRATPTDTLAGVVAVKLLAEGDPARLRREVELVNRLDHPAIVRIESAGFTPPLYVAMELIEGEPYAPTVSRWLDLLEAVAYAHEHGVVHRDLKPANVMICRERVKVLDFGLARGTTSAQLTVPGASLGTPAYMAPEQMQGVASAAVDQYALGVMGYEMMAGRRPFADDLLKLSQAAPPLPETPLNAVIMRMLAGDPAERYPTLKEALDAARQAL